MTSESGNTEYKYKKDQAMSDMFCPECGGFLKRVKGQDINLGDELKEIMLRACGRCKVAFPAKVSQKEVVVKTKKETIRPEVLKDGGGGSITSAFNCPKCGNKKAFFSRRITRADEDPCDTYKCTKCGYVKSEGYAY